MGLSEALLAMLIVPRLNGELGQCHMYSGLESAHPGLAHQLQRSRQRGLGVGKSPGGHQNARVGHPCRNLHVRLAASDRQVACLIDQLFGPLGVAEPEVRLAEVREAPRVGVEGRASLARDGDRALKSLDRALRIAAKYSAALRPLQVP